MYNLNEAKHVNLATEIQAMVEFLSARWNNVDNVQALFELIANAALKNTEGAIGDYVLTTHLHGLRTRRREVMASFTEDSALLSFYDQAYLLCDSMNGAADKVRDTSRATLYDVYADTFKGFKSALKDEALAHLKRAQPKGLRAMTKHYEESDEAWEKALRDEFTDSQTFTGADTGTGSDGGFVSLVSLISVVQQKHRHNTPVVEILLSAAYNHLVRVCTHNNTQAVIADLEQLSPLVEAKHPVFKVELTPQHKLTKVLMTLARDSWRGIETDNPEKDYLESVADRKAQKPLSPEEVAANRAAAAAEISAMFKRVLKPESAKAAKARQAREAQEQQQVRDLLKNAS